LLRRDSADVTSAIRNVDLTSLPIARIVLILKAELFLRTTGRVTIRFVIHDLDSIFSADVDRSLTNLGVRALRTPVRAPKANAVCERLGGSLRRECLDFLLPFHERHLQMTIRDWAIHYNRGRPHSALGPGLPEPMSDQLPSNEHRHSLPIGYRVVKRSVLGGLHHEYGLRKEAA